MRCVYEDLSPAQFESLIVLLCQRLLGIATQGFAAGPDGGRDAKFVGTAELYPSTAAPWVGTVIVQVKHTNRYNRSFSDLAFYSESNNNTVIGKEIPRIKKLREAKQLDHYMLFTNRNLTANTEEKIRGHIATECDIPEKSICLCGVEQLKLWMKKFPQVLQEAELDPLDSPLIIDPNILAEVIEAIVERKDDLNLSNVIVAEPTARVEYEKKNALNKMTADYAKTQRRKYLKEAQQIRDFLAADENERLLRMYQVAVDHFQFKIIAHRKDYQTFDKVMEYLVDMLFSRASSLNRYTHQSTTRAVLFYMYWNCDIGETLDATTDQTLAS